MRHEFAPEAPMSTRHDADERRARVGRPVETEKRLSAGQAVVVIAALSVLSWVVLIAIVIGLRAVF
jgi:hypothetical protein